MYISRNFTKTCFFFQEPKSLYGEKKVFPLAKLDRTTTVEGVKKFIAEEESK